MRWLLTLYVLAGCTEKAPERPLDAAPTAPPEDAAPAPVVDARLPVITMGAAVVEELEPPDAAPPIELKKLRKRRKRPVRGAEPARPKAAPRRATTAMDTIRAHWGEVERCYGAVALKDPTVQGRIVLQWTIGKDGTPTGTAVVQDTLKDKSVGACLKQSARAWKFPPPASGVQVLKYPFDLRVR